MNEKGSRQHKEKSWKKCSNEEVRETGERPENGNRLK